MKKNLAASALTSCLALSLSLVTGAHAQRSPEAALADLRADGRVSNEELFMFQGCPQSDPGGVAVFEAVQGLELDGWGLQYLAKVFSWNVYPTCGYAPLDSWMTTAFRTLHARGDTGPAEAFVSGLGPLIDEDLQQAILQAAADPAFGGSRMREEFVRVALTMRPQADLIAEAIDAFGLAIPAQAIANTTYRLSRDVGPAFFEAIARAAPTMDDDKLFIVSRAIGSEIQDGRVDPNARGLGQIRSIVQARPGSRAADQIPTQRRPSARAN